MNTGGSAGDGSEIRTQHTLLELLTWLEMQKGGVATFYEFQRKSLALRAKNVQQAGLLRLLADLSGRFGDLYDGEPLDLSTASHALQRLTDYVRQAVKLKPDDAEGLLDLVNRVGIAELAPAG